ncbi:MAG: hypothetical protein JSW27_17420 [Phycisphaerales bacterium]|nr:MAG: hypothetical protein JSW27_17420 [Phycisphaerales bacterium]
MRRTLQNFGFLTLVVTLNLMLSAAGKPSVPQFDAGNFDAPQDNLYLPMAIGDTYRYEAEEEDGLIINEITNTSKTKKVEVDGVKIRCTVVYDVEWIEVEGKGQVILEETDDWVAWDNDGNVWYFGEATTEYLYDDEWNLIDTSDEGSWEAGVDGAEPGILMLAEPQPGVSYRQEYYEGEAEDMGRVLKLNARVSVEFGDFEGCLKTMEWTELEPRTIEHKYYAPGVGLVYIEEHRGKTVEVELAAIN